MHRDFYLKNFGSVEYDGVDTGHLLEEHEADGDEERLDVGAVEELAAARGVARVLLGLGRHTLDLAHLVRNVSLAATQPLQCLARLLGLAWIPKAGLKFLLGRF